MSRGRSGIQKRAVPADSLLARYLRPGCYTDCYTVDVELNVTQHDFIVAFYTTWLFRIERVILKLAVSKPSTNRDAEQLAVATTTTFAAWSVEDRNDRELLLCDYQGRTRSWLRTTRHDGDKETTCLCFGSAVVTAAARRETGKSPAPGFGLLISFHKLYSRALLHCARTRLLKLGQA